MARTAIEWVVALAQARGALPESWNPVLGCSRASAGCANCYAAAIAHRFGSGRTSPFAGLTDTDPQGVPRYTGAIRVQEHRLADPLRWRKPRVVFVGDMADLFHAGASDDVIDRVFAAMALAPQHLFLLLTKRPERMQAYFHGRRRNFGRASDVLHEMEHGLSEDDHENAVDDLDLFDCLGRPQPNVWLGVSAEDQAAADARRGDMAALAAAGWHTFVSYEPALGPVDWDGWEFLRWLVSGGESGPHARPSHPDWFRAARDWACMSGVPYFHKQWGEWGPGSIRASTGEPVFRVFDTFQRWVDKAPTWVNGGICLDARGRQCRIGADFMRARDENAFPVTVIHRLGKTRAGRLLDGRTHDEVPS